MQQVISDGFEKQGIRDELTRRRIAAVKAEKTQQMLNQALLKVNYPYNMCNFW